jgi:uncharacterized membrane protein YecN with MAPEG domain
MTVFITSLYAGLVGALLVLLGLAVSLQRRRHRIGVGSGEQPALELAIRVHGNAAEHIPAALILLLLFELNGAPAIAVHAAGIVLVLARVAHASGLASSAGTTRRRFFGTAATWLLMLVLAIAIIGQYLIALFG